MSKYRIVSQTTLSPDSSYRYARSAHGNGAEATIIEAASLLAAARAFELTQEGHAQPARLISVEELVSVNVEALSDDALVFALEHSPAPFGVDTYEGEVIYNDSSFDMIVHGVAEALRESGLLPGLTLAISREDGVFDYCMVEIHDAATGTYRSVGRDPRDLIEDRTLSGRKGVLSVARALINSVVSSHLL